MTELTPTDLARLTDVRDEILTLMQEAEDALRGTSEESSAKAYWMAHIRSALGSESYPTYSATMLSSIEALEEDSTLCPHCETDTLDCIECPTCGMPVEVK